MKKFLRRLFPKEFSSHPSYWRALALGGVFLFLLISQLFTYEKFAEVIRGYGLPGGAVTVVGLAVLIPLLEAAALPVLLSMKMRLRWRRLSKVAAIALPSLWLAIALVTNVARMAEDNTGMFGATISTPNGLWLIVFAGMLLWSSILVIRELPERV